MSHTISAQALRAKVAHIIEQAGSAPAEAAQVADNLVMANLSGHDSHGVGMIPAYIANARSGELHLTSSEKGMGIAALRAAVVGDALGEGWTA